MFDFDVRNSLLNFNPAKNKIHTRMKGNIEQVRFFVAFPKVQTPEAWSTTSRNLKSNIISKLKQQF
jgi:hypothetical protein